MQNHIQVIENLLVAQLALEDADMAVIRFFRRIYPLLVQFKSLNTQEMAEAAGYSAQAATWHRDELTRRGYLLRHNFRSWTLNPKALYHPLLTSILSLNVKIYRNNDLYIALKVSESN